MNPSMQVSVWPSSRAAISAKAFLWNAVSYFSLVSMGS